MKSVLSLTLALSFALAGVEIPDTIRFSDFSSTAMTFWHGSGAGAWGVDLTVNGDGTFEGIYHDSEMGSSGEDYPNGTVYYCAFSGMFSPPTKISDTEYSLIVVSVELKYEPGKEEIIDEILYIYTESFVAHEGDEFRLYLPDMPVSELPQDYLSWAASALSEGAKTLCIYGLYNITEDAGFMSDPAEQGTESPL